MNKPDKQHYVPKCYLNRFCNERRYLYRLNIDDYLSIKRVSPTSICYESSFYTIDRKIKSKFYGLDEHDEMAVESDVLAKFESKYHRMYENLINDKRLKHKNAREFSEFILILKTRTKYWREKVINQTIIDNIDQISEELIEEASRHKTFSQFPKEVLRALSAKPVGIYKTDADSRKYLQVHRLVDSKNGRFSEKVMQALLDSPWTLVINETALPFITTDNPGVSVNVYTGVVHSTGFNEKFVFLLPLSPKHLLRIDCTKKDVSTNKGKVIVRDYPPKNVVDTINMQLIHCADTIVVSSDRECLEHYKRIIAHHRLVNG